MPAADIDLTLLSALHYPANHDALFWRKLVQPVDPSYVKFPIPSPLPDSYLIKTFLACDACRDRKRKCNGARPVCDRCAKKSPQLSCVFDGYRVKSVWDKS